MMLKLHKGKESYDLTHDATKDDTGKSNPGDSESNIHLVAPDGGWGWMCVLGTFIINFTFGTAFRGLGVLYIAFLEKYQGTAMATAWVSGLTALSWGMFGKYTLTLRQDLFAP